MPEVQVGSTSRPIIIKPMIGGVSVTQTQIKNNYSNKYVDDPTTPLNFVLEYKKRGDTSPSTQNWDSAKSTDTEIFFDMPDAFWATRNTYTIMAYWTIGTEKNYTEESVQLEVKDLHKGY